MDPESRDEIDQTLAAVFAVDPPSKAEQAAMGWRFQSGLKNGPSQPSASPRWRVAVAVLALIVMASTAVLIRPDPAAAALNELAEVAAAQVSSVTSPISYSRVTAKLLVTREIPGTAGDEFSYTLPSVSERWTTIDGTQTVAVRTNRPTFPDPQSERIYDEVDQGMSDGIGRTRQFTLTEVQHPAVEDSWPTDPHELTSLVESLPGVHSELDAIDQLLELARSSVVGPARRSAAFRALANLDLDRIQTADFPYLFRHRGRDASGVLVESRFAFDNTATLRYELKALPDGDPGRNLKPGTVLSEATYEVVDSPVATLGDRP